jgi:hypothetical protein
MVVITKKLSRRPERRLTINQLQIRSVNNMSNKPQMSGVGCGEGSAPVNMAELCDEPRELSAHENAMIERSLQKLLGAAQKIDPWQNPPQGYRYHCIITQYGGLWYDGLGGLVDIVRGKIVMREIGDGTAYFFLPNASGQPHPTEHGKTL